LSDSQKQAIITLLQSFGADASVVASVTASLNGQTPATGGTTSSVGDGFKFTLYLSLGATNNEVTELQKRLAVEGVYTGPVTGHFGALTKGAVISYQAKHGISQLGVVGPATRAALNGN
jgi:peptidoglycan hydrolase-like protein with peptidoglycan-binding domain